MRGSRCAVSVAQALRRSASPSSEQLSRGLKGSRRAKGGAGALVGSDRPSNLAGKPIGGLDSAAAGCGELGNLLRAPGWPMLNLGADSNPTEQVSPCSTVGGNCLNKSPGYERARVHSATGPGPHYTFRALKQRRDKRSKSPATPIYV